MDEEFSPTKKKATLSSKFKCKVCKKKFSDKAGHAHHIQLHSNDRPFECEICQHTFKTKKYLNCHIKKVHKPKRGPECSYCGKKFHYQSLLDKHVLIHTNTKPYKCDICGRGFNSAYSLSTHNLIHADAKPFKCTYCKYACRDSSTLRKHQQRHQGIIRYYECSTCGKSFKTKRTLKEHITEIHLEIDLKTTPCEECGKLFKSKSSLASHKNNVHKRVYECECDICGLKITTRYNMASHLRSHVNLRPYKCSYAGCDKTYKDTSSLRKHALIHYPERQAACEVCGKRFTRHERLRRHRRQHLPRDRDTPCHLCGTRFYNENYVRVHIYKKHGAMPRYICDTCGFSSRNKPGLVMHMRKGHDSEMDRQCKICMKTFKRHAYLKLHYWNTHFVKYKMAVRGKPKKKKSEEVSELPDDFEGILDTIKEEIESEPGSDTDQTEYSKNVLAEEVKKVIFGKSTTGRGDKDFEALFLEHVMKPGPDTGKISYIVDEKLERRAQKRIKRLLKRARRDKGVVDEGTGQHNIETTTIVYETNHSDNDNLRPTIETNLDNDNVVLKRISENNRQTDLKDIISENTGAKNVISENMENYGANVISETISEIHVTNAINENTIERKVSENTEESNTINENTADNLGNVVSDKTTKRIVKSVNENTPENNALNVSGNTAEKHVRTVRRENIAKNYIVKVIIENVAEDVGNVLRENTEEKNIAKVIPENTADKSVRNIISEKVAEKNGKNLTSENIAEKCEENINKNTKANVNNLENDIVETNTVNNLENTNIEENVRNIEVLENSINSENKEIENYQENQTTEIIENDNHLEERSDTKREATSAQSNWCRINSHQCYVCLKLYQTKEELLDHCKEHFDVCNKTILKKCPLCDYVTNLNLARHLSLTHNIDIKLGSNSLKDRKDNNNGSRFYYNVNNDLVKEIEVIPSVKCLNKQAYMKLDKEKRESKSRGLQKTKLVKRGGEWLIENKILSIKESDLDVYKGRDLSGDYLAKVKAISRIAKNNGQSVMFPCNKCEKICQTFSALTLHYRKHEENPKPYKPKVWKHKTKNIPETSEPEIKTPEISKNRYEKPKPISNNHRCDPKLMEFYEKNIKGSDIEFWHFLKIYNKMSRENINDFPDLINRPEFGIHFHNETDTRTITDNAKTIDKNTTDNTNVNKQIGINKMVDLNIKSKSVPKKCSYNRVVRISKKDYQKRKAIQERLRQNVAAKSST